jgi:predicted metal-dependent hydrolase
MSAMILPARLEIDRLRFDILPRPARRTLEITVERDASLSIKAPDGVTLEQLESFVAAKRDWIYRKLAEKDAFLGAPVLKQFVNGEGFEYLGRSYRLQLVDSQSVPVRSERGRLRVRRDDVVADGASVMQSWYQTVGERWLRKRVRPLAARLGAEEVGLRVTGLGYRWGSTRGSDRINIHWATLQLRPSLIDYVLVHELAHLREPNHTAAFWEWVRRAMPDYEARMAQLAERGSSVWTGETAVDQT